MATEEEQTAKDLAEKAGHTASDLAVEAGQTAKDLASTAGHTAKDLAGEAGQTAKDLAEKAGQTAKDLAGEAGQTARDLAEEAGQVAKSLAAQAESLQTAVVTSLVNENRKFRRQSRLQTIAILILGVILAVNTWNTFLNRQVIDKVDQALSGVEGLTAYVDQIKASSAANAENTKALYAAIFKTQEDVAKTLAIVCSAADPLRKVACEEAGVTGTVTEPAPETPPAKPPAAPHPSEQVVARDDTLWALARKLYGDGRLWPRIYEANRDQIANPSVIYAGQVLTIPSAG